jgi:toxin ParE1/3/4
LRRVELSSLAEGDLADIWIAIATSDIEVADRFVDELRALAQKIADQPHMGRARPEIGEGVRVFPHRDYLLIYRVQSAGIGIARVVHGKRDLTQLEVREQRE